MSKPTQESIHTPTAAAGDNWSKSKDGANKDLVSKINLFN